MNESYKHHSIRSDALGTTEGWRAVIQVSWLENNGTKMRLWMDGRFFATRPEAEMEGQSVAKKWIDEGKPDPTH